MYPIEYTVSTPFPEIVVDRGVRREILRQQPPLAAGAVDIANGVEDLAHVGRAVASARTRRRDHRRDDRPLLVADVARIATATRLVRLAMFFSPHGSPLIRLP